MARRLKYILEIWDAGTAIGRAMRNILGTIAELEADTILERTMGGRRRNLPAGKYGYTCTLMDRVRHIPGRVTINPEQAAVLRMYQRRALGLSYERIATELTADGIKSPAGKSHWMYTTVRRIIGDPTYKGQGLWGVDQALRSERSGKRVYRPRRLP